MQAAACVSALYGLATRHARRRAAGCRRKRRSIADSRTGPGRALTSRREAATPTSARGLAGASARCTSPAGSRADLRRRPPRPSRRRPSRAVPAFRGLHRIGLPAPARTQVRSRCRRRPAGTGFRGEYQSPVRIEYDGSRRRRRFRELAEIGPVAAAGMHHHDHGCRSRAAKRRPDVEPQAGSKVIVATTAELTGRWTSWLARLPGQLIGARRSSWCRPGGREPPRPRARLRPRRNGGGWSSRSARLGRRLTPSPAWRGRATRCGI